MDSDLPSNMMSKTIPEDTLKYYLFVVDDTINENEHHETLRQVCQAAKKLMDTLLADYIWQRDGFSVSPVELAGMSKTLN